jgi:hypothetical protein
MNGELSHNLPQLITSGNRILRADDRQPVLLRGLNRSGLEYSEPSEAGFLAAAGLTEDEIREMVLNWRANIIRLPFNQDWVLRGRNGHPAAEYMASLDQAISWAAALGAYTILDLQWLDADTAYGHTRDANQEKKPNRVAPTPDAGTILLWETLSARYKDEPAVVFDLFNEPHDPLDDDFLPIHLVDEDGSVTESDAGFVGAEEWGNWAAYLVSRVRRVRPAGLILVGGVDWAFDLRGIRVDAPGIVYSAHIYPNHARHSWDKALGRAGEVPVFVGEWGGTDADLDFGRTLADRMRLLGLGWTAWSWADYPPLVREPRAPYEPTAFGELVRSELKRDAD